MTMLKKRREFLALRDGRKSGSKTFLLVAGHKGKAGEGVRIGVTVTKKMGGAVSRNRIRRRLKAAASQVFPRFGVAGIDYVIIARKAALDCNFETLLDDMKRSLLSLRRNTT